MICYEIPKRQSSFKPSGVKILTTSNLFVNLDTQGVANEVEYNRILRNLDVDEENEYGDDKTALKQQQKIL